MTRAEALRALADGKKVQHPNGGDPIVFWVDPVLGLFGGGLDSQGKGWRPCMIAPDGYTLAPEPNPHTPGTFAWARFEATQNGRRIRCDLWAAHQWTEFPPGVTFTLGEIDATDWELA